MLRSLLLLDPAMLSALCVFLCSLLVITMARLWHMMMTDSYDAKRAHTCCRSCASCCCVFALLEPAPSSAAPAATVALPFSAARESPRAPLGAGFLALAAASATVSGPTLDDFLCFEPFELFFFSCSALAIIVCRVILSAEPTSCIRRLPM